MHRDIKPENILVFPEGVKLADFGTANYVDRTHKDTVCGTPEYLCPEMITKQGHNQKVDVWCLGVLMYEMLSGKTPFMVDHTAKSMTLEEKFKALTINILVGVVLCAGYRGDRFSTGVFHSRGERSYQQVSPQGPRTTYHV